MRTLLIAVTLALFACTAAFSQDDFDKVEIKVTKAGGNVYMLEGAGGNIGVSAGEDGIVIVDDQFAPLAPKIRAALKGISDKPVRFVLNTHYHGDHTGGNEAFGETAPIIAQTNVRDRLAKGSSAAGRTIPPAPKAALPVITFDESLVVHLNGEDIRAVHFPHGHTDGDAVIWFSKSNVVHMGDDFFSGRFPFVDIDSGGSVRGVLANVDRIIPMIPVGAKIIPGHGPLSTIDDLKAYRDMLAGVISIVEAGIKAGKTADQLKQEHALAKYDKYSWDFITADTFIDIVYRDLKK